MLFRSLHAEVEAGVRRFIPSDFSEEFTRTPSGLNRNLDLRREFMAVADRANIQVTSILNGAFMDMLGAEFPLIQPRIGRVLCWRSADQPLDFTTKDDVAAYSAAAALDTDTPRLLRIAGDSITVRELAAILTAIGSRTYRPMKVGTIGTLGLMIRVARFLSPGREETFPPWQGMQYMRDMFSGAGKLEPLDNDRYPDVPFTRVRAYHTGLRARW